MTVSTSVPTETASVATLQADAGLAGDPTATVGPVDPVRTGTALSATASAEPALSETILSDTALSETAAAVTVRPGETPVDTARRLAAAPHEWIQRVRLSAEERWYERLHGDDDHEVWLISWLPGQATGLHDHGGSRGAFAVALGDLEEHDLGGSRRLGAGDVREFGPAYVHEVLNSSAAPAISVHVYSPPLSVMNRYDRTPEGLVKLAEERASQW